MMRKNLNQFAALIAVLLLTITSVDAQNQWNYWYFGNNAGLNFNSGSPVPALGGQFAGTEGGACYSDPTTGNLMFYTDGRLVWNRNHVQMPNGFGLMGGFTQCSQSSMIVPLPGSNHLYYLFTADENGTGNGIRYSVVDMNLAAGLGDVVSTQKNILMYMPASEQQTYVRKANGVDYWILSHEINTNTFRAYTLSSTGVSATYVSSSLGAVINTGGQQIGYLRPNHIGTKLCKAARYLYLYELFDFDNSTGVVSNVMTMNNLNLGYGAEFSIDNTKLYVHTSNPGQVYQYDATATTQAALNASRTPVGSTSSTWVGPLFMGKDCRIYMGRYQVGSLGVINFPNLTGNACNYVDNGVGLGGPTSQLSLPNFNYDWNPCEIITAAFTWTTPCVGDSTMFHNSSVYHIASNSWFFGDNGSGPNDSSTLVNPAHFYTTAGNYNVMLIVVDSSGNIDTVVHQVTVNPMPSVNLGNDTTLCTGPALTLNAGNVGATFIWNTGATTQTITTDTSGTFWVIANYGVCVDTDSVTITFLPMPVVNLGNDTTLCLNQPITLDAGNVGSTYLWSNGATTQTISPTSSGVYWVIANLNGCLDQDSITVTFIPIPTVYLGSDTTLCVGMNITLDAGNVGLNYLWSTGTNTETINVTTSGNYWVKVTQNVCFNYDTINVTFVAAPVVNLGNDISVCFGVPVSLDAGNPIATYLWSTGETTRIISPTTSGTYIVVASIGTCWDSDTVLVTFNPLPIVHLGPDKTLCTGETLTLDGGNAGATYQWSNGGTDETTNITTPGTYSVIVHNGGCTNSDTINVAFITMPTVNLGPDQILCQGESALLNAGNAGLLFSWSNSSTTQTIKAAVTGTYVVCVNHLGCKAYDTVNILIDSPPPIPLRKDTAICPGDQMQLSAGKGFKYYSWLPGRETSYQIIIYNPGTYIVNVIDTNNCPTEASVLVREFCPSQMFIPNAFTPNSNGINDMFLAYCDGAIDFHMYIFNRWGELVFESTDIGLGWDGTYMGTDAQAGVYIYKIDYKLMDYTEIKKYSKVGNVNLTR